MNILVIQHITPGINLIIVAVMDAVKSTLGVIVCNLRYENIFSCMVFVWDT